MQKMLLRKLKKRFVREKKSFRKVINRQFKGTLSRRDMRSTAPCQETLSYCVFVLITETTCCNRLFGGKGSENSRRDVLYSVTVGL